MSNMAESSIDDSVIHLHFIDPLENIAKVKSVWLYLSERSQHSYFLTWHWFENWILSLPQPNNVQFCFATAEGQPVLAFFYGTTKGIRHKCIYATRAHLNETGLQPLDTITIQKQGVLYDSESQYLNGALQKLFLKSSSEWDELIGNSITQEQFELLHQLRNNVYLELMEQTGSYYVDLDKVREHGLLGLVSKNKKNQIKQSLKAYSKVGEVSVSLAQNCEQAKQAMDALVGLHQKYWQGKGLKGSFANPFFKQFHYQMVTRNFDAERVQLLTVRCGSRIIGVLYNFIHQHNVYFYQCGFDYSSDNKFRPGLVSHYLAIEHYAKQNFSRYDFLTGESRYKASLSTNQEQVYSVKVQRKKIRFYFEHNLRRLKSKIRAIV